MAAYIPPDSVVPPTPQFEFLWRGGTATPSKRRIRAQKLRGLLSPGLVMPTPPGSKVGDDLAAAWDITHWEPLPNLREVTSSNAVVGPQIPMANQPYDLENGYRYIDAIPTGTWVNITEKIHGANGRFVYHEGDMYCGSRKRWTAYDEDKLNVWWKILGIYDGIREFCTDNPGQILYGEIFGRVQNLHYESTMEDPLDFRAFDIFNGNNKFIDYPLAYDIAIKYDIPWVPSLGMRQYEPDEIVHLVDGDTTFRASHEREGIVVGPRTELPYVHNIGRVKLKFVSSNHLYSDQSNKPNLHGLVE
jgi:RNA ligase (TIGR02306 family)